MRKTRKHSWLIGLALVLILAVCLSLPVAASAPVSEGDDGVGTVQEGGTVPSDGFPNLPAGTVLVGNNATTLALDTEELYGVEVFAACGEGVEFASYEVHLYLPAFMTFDSVVCSDENALFTWNYESDILSVACSTTTDRAADSLFTIYFYLNEDATLESAGAFESAGEYFTNTSYEKLPVVTFYGEISVYEEMPLKGDVNLDGEITIDDAIALQRILVRLDDEPRYFTDGYYAADVNNDHMLTIVDVQYIQMYLIGEIDSLEDIYAEDPLLLIRVNFFDQYGNVLANRIVTAPPAGAATTTYPALVEFVNQWAGSLFPGMTVESLYAESGADVYAATSIVTGDDVLNVFLRSDKGDEPFTYDESEVQTNGWLNGDTIVVYQNCEPADIWEAINGKTFVIERYVMRDGTRYTVGVTEVTLTADNLGDLAGIDFNEMGSVSIPVVVNGAAYTVNGRVIPDLRNANLIAEAVRIETHTDQFGVTETYRDYAALYDNGIMATCGLNELGNSVIWFNYLNYTVEYDNDVMLYAVDEGGMVCYYVIDENASYEGYPVVTAYAPAADDPTEEYTLAIEGYQLRFVVFNECFAMTYHSTGAADDWEFGGTIKVEVDLENGTFTFRDIVYDIGGDNVLSIGLPDEAPVEVVYYMGETIVFNLYEGGDAYYMMNGQVMGTATWEVVLVTETEDGVIPIELVITLAGNPQRFYRWDDGNWYMMEEPDFEEATATEVTLDGETATVYAWEGQDKALLKRGEEAPFEIGYYNASARMFSLYGMESEYFLIRDGEMVRVDYCQLIYDGNTQYIYVGDGYAYGWLGALSGYRGIDMTYVVDEDGLWTFYDGLNVVMTCTKSDDQDNVFIMETGTAPVEGEETVTLTMKYVIDGTVVEDLTQIGSIQAGMSLDFLVESIGTTTESKDGESTLLVTGVYYDAAGRKSLYEGDVVKDNLVLYVFMTTVEE